jgi:Leucine-rich repeat (LRR) protein
MSLNNNRLTKLPQDLGSLDELTQLDVTNNRLQALPSDLGVKLLKRQASQP